MSDTVRFEVVTIDLDDTLWDNAPTLEGAERRLHEWLQRFLPRLAAQYSIDDLKAHRRQLADQEPPLRHDLTRLRLESLSRLAREAQYPEELAHAAMEIFLQARNEVTLYDDVIPALTELRRQYRLVALSNGNADVNEIGLAHFFELAISPAHVGTSKPDPDMFHAVVQRLNVDRATVLHVGDEPATDILGAQRAGIRNVWVNRGGAEWPGALARPDAEVRSLSELLPIERLFT